MKYIYLSFLLLIPLIGFNQEINQNVIVTSGDYYENEYGSLSWTIGQTITKTLSDGTTSLTQGFHQGKLSVSTLTTDQEFDNSLKVYPNPVVNILNIEANDPELKFILLNQNGQTIKKGTIQNQSKTIDFLKLLPGSYILKINNKKTYKIIKH